MATLAMKQKQISTSIRSYLDCKDIDGLKTLVNEANVALVLDSLEDLPTEELLIAYRLLAKEKALFVFEQLETSAQKKLLRSFTEEKAIEIVEAMAPDDRARLFDELPAKVAKKLLGALSSEERQMTNLLLGYEAESTGRIMTPEYLRLTGEMTVEDAMATIKESAHDKETVNVVYVTNDSRKLEGAVTLLDLIMAHPLAKVSEIMKPATSVTTNTDREETARLLQDLDLLAIPVTDMENRLVGIVTVDDAMDILEEEATEDLYIHAGLDKAKAKESVRSNVMINGNLWHILKIRIPILLMVLAGGFLAGLIVEGFEEALEAATMIAFFIPLIMDMGGSVGGQSTTVFARGFVLGHIKAGAFWKQFGKEALVGFAIGSIVGFFAYFGVGLWLGDWHLALAVALALVANCLIAASAGFLVPFLLIKIGADQAAGSGPIITSIKDITGLLVYFFLIVTFLDIDALSALEPYEAVDYGIEALDNLNEYAIDYLSPTAIEALEYLQENLEAVQYTLEQE